MCIQLLRLVVTGIAFAALTAAPANANPLPTQPHIYVEGYSEIEVEPDQMTITVNLAATDEDLASAKATVDENSRTLLDALRELGVESRDVATTTLQVRPAYERRRGNQELVGASAFRQIEITLQNLEDYGELMQGLVAADVSRTLRTRFAVSNDSELKDLALKAALADARARAEGIANSQGEQLGAVYSISEFDLRQEETYSLRPHREVSGNAARDRAPSTFALSSTRPEPFEPGVMVARARVFVVYLLDRETVAEVQP